VKYPRLDRLIHACPFSQRGGEWLARLLADVANIPGDRAADSTRAPVVGYRSDEDLSGTIFLCAARTIERSPCEYT